MSIEDLLKACSSGNMPLVVSSVPIRGASSPIGQVMVIKVAGCAVRFTGLDYDTWFWETDEKDRRKHYTRELTIL